MKILFRTDASASIGLGHAMRCLALAQAAKDQGHSARFAMNTVPPSFEERLRGEDIEVVAVTARAGGDEDAVFSAKTAKDDEDDWIVADGYHFSTAYQSAIKKSGRPLLFIDDYGHGAPYCADMILNQNCYAPRHPEWYEDRPASSQLLLGCAYTLLRREFRNADRAHVPLTDTSILVTMGGSDPKNVTLAVLQALARIRDIPMKVIVVIGGANPHLAAISAAAEGMTIVTDAKDMPSLMRASDLAIAAAGTTAYELAFLGVPALLTVTAENQRPVAEEMAKRNVAVLLGDPLRISEEETAASIASLLRDAKKRSLLSENGKTLVDGRGAKRVLAAMTDTFSSQ